MTFAAVLALFGIRLPANRWAFGWLREGLKDFDDSAKDDDLSIRASDWRVSRRVWCERRHLPSWVVTIPWTGILYASETLVISLCVEMVFTFFMVEAFHRLSPYSALTNVPAGLIAGGAIALALRPIF